MDIVGIPKQNFADVSGLLSWHFESFVDRSGGEESMDHLMGEVFDGKRQCWIAWDGRVRACGLTQVVNNDMKVVEFTHCAGDGRKEWNKKMVDEIRNWAKHIGANRMRVINRPGHTPMLKGMGFKETHRILEQDIV